MAFIPVGTRYVFCEDVLVVVPICTWEYTAIQSERGFDWELDMIQLLLDEHGFVY